MKSLLLIFLLFPFFAWAGGAKVRNLDAPSVAAFNRMAQREAKRAPAAVPEVKNPQNSSEFRMAVQRLRLANNANELDAIISEFDARYDSYPADLQLLTIQLTFLRVYRSWLWRFSPLLDSIPDAKRNYQVYGRNYIFGLIGMPIDSNWEQIWRYISAPQRAFQPAFSSLSQMQAYNDHTVYPALLKMIQRLSGMNFENEQIYASREFPLGFTRDETMPQKFILADFDRMAILAKMHRLAYLHSVALAYEQAYFLPLQARLQLRPVHHLNAILSFAQIQQLEKINEIRQSSEGELIRLQIEGDVWMQRAYMHLYSVIGYSRAAWTQSQVDRGRAQAHIRAIFPDLAVVNDRAIMQLWSLVENEGKASINVGRGILSVDLRSFFQKPPIMAVEVLPPRKSNSYQRLFPDSAAGAEQTSNLNMLLNAMGFTNIKHPILLLSPP